MTVMKRTALALLLCLLAFAATAQPVTVIGPITPGDCTMFSSTTVVKDGGFPCPGSGGTLALPNGTTATTQTLGDNTTKVATDAFVQSATGLLPPSACAGPRVAKTANYSVLNADKGSLFSLGGSTFFTLTLNAPSGYDSNFGICVKNEDTVRMKFIFLNGWTGAIAGPNGTQGFFLCPGATQWISNDNNVWISSGPQRCFLNADTAVFATSGGTDWTTGANDCLATGAGCGTPQKAYDLAAYYFDLQTHKLTIQFDAGTYTLSSGVTAISMLGNIEGSGRQGTQGSPVAITGAGVGSTILNLTNANAFACDQNCSIVVQAMTINLTGGSGNQGNCFISDNQGAIQFGTVACTGNNGTPANHVAQANLSAQIQCIGPVTVAGSFANGIFAVTANSGFACDTQTITFSAATTAAAFLDARSEAYIEFLSNTITNPGNLTAAAYNIPSQAIVDATGTTLPGTAGIVTNGGRIKGAAPQVQAPRICDIISTAAATCNNGDAMANNGTLTTPTGATALETECVGGGGGGAGSGTTPGAATGGGNTTFGTVTANGGPAGSTSAGSACTPASASGGDTNINGAAGGPSSNSNNQIGGQGGNSYFGGAGQGGSTSGGNGLAAQANTGSGGGGGSQITTTNGGGGGCAGAYARKLFTSPAATFSYGIGAAGTGGTLGTGGTAGANGAAGRCYVKAIFN